MVVQVAVADATPNYDKLYSYDVPASLQGHIFVGSLVLVPFGRGAARPRLGVAVRVEENTAPGAALKPIWDAAPAGAALSEELLALVEWLREATFCTWFEAVRAVLPRGAQYKVAKVDGAWKLVPQLARQTQRVYAAAQALPAGGVADVPGLTKKQRDVLAFVQSGPQTAADIQQGCSAGPAVAKALVKKGWLREQQQDKAAPLEDFAGAGPGQAGGGVILTPAQRAVADGLLAEMARPAPKPALLYGVTGSGKTPIFIAMAEAALAAGKTALVLVPEIGLTPQMTGSLRAAFGARVAVQHSGLSHSQRLDQWRGVKNGSYTVVVGTRSAVFAPLENIGVIVVDEEQEHTYQSENAPRYSAVEVARLRAQRHGALLLLASATPSVESYYQARQGRYTLHTLALRYANLPLPEVEMVDMAAELLAGNASAISGRLAAAMAGAIAAGGQVILLLNRRGYHRVALCRSCGAAVKCGECSVPMVYHRPARRAPANAGAAAPFGAAMGPEGPAAGGWLLCHHCGRVQRPAPTVCPECGGEMRYAGFGTQRLEEELAEALPGARVLRMDMDTTQRKGAHAGMLARFAAGEYDILLGTQMVAKGLDFEKVQLVGVIGIDSLLFAQGYRAFEHVFSLVTQVVGRSGRATAGGQAIIQTVDPNHPVLRLAAQQNYPAFYEDEIGFRRLALYPPFCSLCTVGFAAEEEAEAMDAARRFARLLASTAKDTPAMPLRVLGPAPMQVARLAGSYRCRLTLKCRGDKAFRTFLRGVLAQFAKDPFSRKAAVWVDFHAEG